MKHRMVHKHHRVAVPWLLISCSSSQGGPFLGLHDPMSGEGGSSFNDLTFLMNTLEQTNRSLLR